MADLTDSQQEIVALYDDLAARFIAYGDPAAAKLATDLKELWSAQVTEAARVFAAAMEFRDDVNRIVAGIGGRTGGE